MIDHLEARTYPDLRVYLALHGGRLPEADAVPPYTTDEALIRDAVQDTFAPVALSWKDCWKGTSDLPHLTVRRNGRKLFREFCEGTRAQSLCTAAIKLAALLSVDRPVPVLQMGFYWFRPSPGVYFYPERFTFQREGVRHGYPFAFCSSEPFPVFVVGGGGRAVVTGIGCPLDWPDNDGAIPVPINRLPGEFGPRIEPPTDWHADYHPEQLDPYLDLWDDEE